MKWLQLILLESNFFCHLFYDYYWIDSRDQDLVFDAEAVPVAC